MSDISQFIPSGALQNIAARGQNRLDAAKAVVQDKISKNNMVKGIEASLGGLKTVTFGKDVFNATAKAIGDKLKNRAAVKAQGGSRTASKTEPVEPEQDAGDAPEAVADAARAAPKPLDDPPQIPPREAADEDGTEDVTAEDMLQAGKDFQSRIASGDVPSAAESADLRGGAKGIFDSMLEEDAGGGAAPAAVRAAPAEGEAPDATAAAARAAPKPKAKDADTDAPELPTAPKPLDTATPEIAAEGEAGGIGEVGAVAETGLLEGLGGILDATGVGAPLGLALGFVGLGLAAHKDKAVNLVSPDNRGAGGYSYQAGI